MKYIVILALTLVVLSCRNNSIHGPGSPLPKLDLLLIDSITRMTTEEIPKGKSIVFMYFSPNCVYCNEEIDLISANMPRFQEAEIILLSQRPFSEVKQFYYTKNLNRYKNIKVSIDADKAFYNYFKPTGIPFLAFYNKDRQLKALFEGRAELDFLIEMANK